jgi:hypothetical protein
MSPRRAPRRRQGQVSQASSLRYLPFETAPRGSQRNAAAPGTLARRSRLPLAGKMSRPAGSWRLCLSTALSSGEAPGIAVPRQEDTRREAGRYSGAYRGGACWTMPPAWVSCRRRASARPWGRLPPADHPTTAALAGGTSRRAARPSKWRCYTSRSNSICVLYRRFPAAHGKA